MRSLLEHTGMMSPHRALPTQESQRPGQGDSLSPMALQEPVLRAASFSFALPFSVRFADVQGALTDILRKAAGSEDDWLWDSSPDGPLVHAWNGALRLHLTLTPSRLDVSTEEPDLELLTEVAERAAAACLEALGSVEAVGSGAGGIWLLAAEAPEDARKAVEEWAFRPGLRDLLAPFGGRPDDLRFQARFDGDDGLTTHMEAEPVTDEEAAQGPFFLSDVEVDELPPAAVVVNAQRRQSRNLSAGEMSTSARRHLDQLFAQVDKLLATIGDRDDVG